MARGSRPRARAASSSPTSTAGAERRGRDRRGRAALACDVTDAAHVDAPIGAAESAFGPSTCSAPTPASAVGTDLATPGRVGPRLRRQRARAHPRRRAAPARLARARPRLLPHDRVGGGACSQIGSAPYAVTKHAAVAFAEWLSITYGDRGVGVSCLCPMGVNTPLLTTARRRGGLGDRVVAAAAPVLEPDEVADVVVDGLREERFLILPHPEVLEFFRARPPTTTAGWPACAASRRASKRPSPARRAGRARSCAKAPRINLHALAIDPIPGEDIGSPVRKEGQTLSTRGVSRMKRAAGMLAAGVTIGACSAPSIAQAEPSSITAVAQLNDLGLTHARPRCRAAGPRTAPTTTQHRDGRARRRPTRRWWRSRRRRTSRSRAATIKYMEITNNVDASPTASPCSS